MCFSLAIFCFFQTIIQVLWCMGRHSGWSPYWFAGSKICPWWLLLPGSPGPNEGLSVQSAASLETTHTIVRVQKPLHCIKKCEFCRAPIISIVGSSSSSSSITIVFAIINNCEDSTKLWTVAFPWRHTYSTYVYVYLHICVYIVQIRCDSL